MSFLKSLSFVATLALALPAAADDGVTVSGAYALTTGAAAAVYLELENLQGEADILLSARSEMAQKVTIHHSAETAEGVMRMAETTLPVPASASLILRPGQDHIMLMGLTRKLAEGDMIPLILSFERAGEVTVEVLVTRQPPAPKSP